MFFSNAILKKIYKLQLQQLPNALDLFIFNRSSRIPLLFMYKNIKIYNGVKWIGKFILKWILGFKFGELTWNRKLALFKAKQLKKKKK